MFEDEAFSKSRLKSCFLFTFSSWASLVLDVEHPFVRDFQYSLALALWAALFLLFCFRSFFWLALVPLCIRPVYPLRSLFLFFGFNIFVYQ